MSETGERSGPRGTYNRGYIPHFDHVGVIQAVTFRLADALPKGVEAGLEVDELEAELGRGHGSCVLRNAEVARVVEGALRHFDGQRYDLGPWVIMPNHVHILMRPRPRHALGAIMHSWKSFTAKKINALVDGKGPVWQREYFDRMIRNHDHLLAATRYVHENPVAAGLVERAQDWAFSSARDPRRLARWLGT